MTADSTSIPAAEAPKPAQVPGEQPEPMPAAAPEAQAAPAAEATDAAQASANPPDAAPTAPAVTAVVSAGRRLNARLWLKWGAIGVVALALAAILGGYFLPREPEVTRAVEIAAPRGAVFPLVADLRHLPEWSPWLVADPDVGITFTGPLDGVGQTLAWESKVAAVGSGVETITAVTPDGSVEMSVTRSGQPSTAAWFQLSAKGANQTVVVWGYRKDLGFNPIERYRGLTIDGLIGPEYERGLQRLKAVAEAPKAN